MRQSKLLAILKSLDKVEIKRLVKFLHAPYFMEIKQKNKALELFELLLPYYPQYDQEELEKEKIYARLFSGVDYSSGKMDKLMNRLLLAVKQFIAFEYSNKDDFTFAQELAQIQFYRKKKMDTAFLQSIRQLKKKQQKIKKRSQQYYFQEHQIEIELTLQASFYNQRKADLNLPKTMQSLDIFYVVSRLEYLCSLLSQRNFHVPLSLEEDLMMFKELSNLIEKYDYLQVPTVLVFYEAVQLLYPGQGATEARFNQFLTTLTQYQDEIPEDELRALQTICRSYCIHSYNEGKEHYLTIAFDLYRKHLEDGHLYYDQGIFAGMLKNLVAIGLKLAQYDWVLDLLQNHKDRIIGTNAPDEAYRFNLSTYYFAKKEYLKALEYLSGYEEDTYYKIAAKRLELKAYFELRSPILESKMTAFKVYLFRVSNTLLPELARRGNNNFINILKQIYNPLTFRKGTRIDKLIGKINQKKGIVERQWLLQKLEEMR